VSGAPRGRTDALGRALRRAAERECARRTPGLRERVLASLAEPEALPSKPHASWRVAASVAALFTVGALALFAWRAARAEWDWSAARGTERDPELAVPRVAPQGEVASAHGALRTRESSANAPRERTFLARTLPESRALDVALRGELAGLGRDTLAGARFLFERARLGPPPRGS